jgi:hypothetical protein
MFRDDVPWRMEPPEKYRRMKAEFGTREIPRDDYPMLVTFGDIDDPTSVQRVDPENLAATFGAGVRLKRITLTITDDPLTEKIEGVLGWYSEYWNNSYRLAGERRIANRNSLEDLPGTLGPGSFKVRARK